MDDLSDRQTGKREQLYVCAHVHACINSMDPIQDGAPKFGKSRAKKEVWKRAQNLPCLVPFGALHNMKKKKLI